MLCSCCFRSTRAATFAAYLIAFICLAVLPYCSLWLMMVARRGFGSSFDDSPLAFTVMFAISGGVVALVGYGIAAIILRKLTRFWRTRAFRMAVFGGAYALLLLVLSTPRIVDGLMGSNLYVLSIAHPFISLYRFVADDPFHHYYAHRIWTPLATIVFSAGLTYIFERLSTLRFNMLRNRA